MNAANETKIPLEWVGEYKKWMNSPFLYESPLICGLIEGLGRAHERVRVLREALEHLLAHSEMRGDACKLLAVGKAQAALASAPEQGTKQERAR